MIGCKINSNLGGLRIKWLPKTSAAKGVGGDATCIGVAMIPVGIARVNGLLETTVVDDGGPLLLPVCMLVGLKAVVDLQYMKLYFKEYGVEEPMRVLPSGHVTVDVMKFDGGHFSMPLDVPGCVQEDFQAPSHDNMFHGGRRYHSAVMAQPKTTSDPNPETPPSNLGNGHAFDGTPQEDQEPCGCTAPAKGADGIRTSETGARPLQGSSRLAGGHGQSDHFDDLRRVQGHRGRLVSAIATLAWLTLVRSPGGDVGRCVRERSLAPLKSKEAPNMSICNCVHPRRFLRGGGNASLSYIVRRLCHARWESPMTVAEIKKYMKENKNESGGLLSQHEAPEMEVDMEEWQNLENANQVELLRVQLMEEQAKVQAAEEKLRRLKASMATSSMGRAPKAKAKQPPGGGGPSGECLAEQPGLRPGSGGGGQRWDTLNGDELKEMGSWCEVGGQRARGHLR